MFNKLYRIMGLKDKVDKKAASVKETSELTQAEVSFIISKLRKATYIGTEFEQFYQIMAKLTSVIDKK